MKRRYVITLATLIVAANVCHAATNDFFTTGMAAARAGKIREAAAAFENAAAQQPASGTLGNLANEEWQRGHAGMAILAWERALWIDPFDEHAAQNLRFARAVVQLDEPQLNWFEAASTRLPAAAWLWIAGTGLWLAVGAFVLPGIFRRRKSGWQQTLAALGICIFVFSFTANLGVISRAQIGFVVKRDARLLLTPTREGEMVSTVTEGEAARILRKHGDYFLVRTTSATGWIDRSQFAPVCANGR